MESGWRHGVKATNGTRSGVADALGVGVSRLRGMEGAGTLPKWREALADDYLQVAHLVLCARQMGMTALQVRRAVAAIRRAESFGQLCEKQEAAMVGAMGSAAAERLLTPASEEASLSREDAEAV